MKRGADNAVISVKAYRCSHLKNKCVYHTEKKGITHTILSFLFEQQKRNLLLNFLNNLTKIKGSGAQGYRSEAKASQLNRHPKVVFG